MFRTIVATDGRPVLEVAYRRGLLLPAVALRPLARGETAPLQRVLDGLSPGSRYFRFLTGTPELGPGVLARLADVDHDRHGCWVATASGVPVGIGRYVRDRTDPHTADLALEVADACHGLGLGRLLVEVLAAAAVAVGVRTLVWLADEDNEPVRRPAAVPGARFTVEHGMVEGTVPVPELPARDAAPVARCARLPRVLAGERAA